MAKLTKKQQQELASIKVWSTINQSLVDTYPRIEEEVNNEPEMCEFETKVREIANEIGWEALYLKLTAESTINTRPGTKMEKAVVIFQEMKGQERKYVIKEFMDKLEMGKEGAATYYQTIKTKLSTGKVTEEAKS